MEYSQLLTHEELEFALHAYATYLMYKNDNSDITDLPESEFDSDDCQMYIEDSLKMYLAAVKNYLPVNTYFRLSDMSTSILKKLSDTDDAEWEKLGYYKKPYSYGDVWVKD